MTEYQHGGDVYTQEIELDFSANINPLGLPESVKQAVIRSLDVCGRYPDSRSEELIKALSNFHEVPKEWLICANGASDLIFQVVQAGKLKKALLLAPSFAEYEQALKTTDCQIHYFDLKEESGFLCEPEKLLECLDSSCDVLFLCNPNNPTGLPLRRYEVEQILADCAKKHILVVLDECFCDFLSDPGKYSVLDRIGDYPNLILIRAFTKLYAMAGIRLGYGISSNRQLLNRMEAVRQPWSVSAIAQAAGIAALGERDYVQETRKLIQAEREFLAGELRSLGFFVYPSAANYLFFRDLRQTGEGELGKLCKERKLLIRSCANYRGLNHQYYRICVKQRPDNEKMLRILEWAVLHKTMAKSIMIQGTMSNAGKSLLTAGLCRILKQDGFKTAPFKSQNMALNSYITADGLEMGRAQAVQAQAADIQPEVSMNPILLKPTTDMGSQVIVNGIPIGSMPAKDYFAYKKQLIPDILNAYHRLEEEYDIIVIEGAGSPAEINLKTDDIVNMGLARMVNAPVLLVGDIDRGGVFAQLYGTVELLEPEERARIQGLLINKFRGDPSILSPGVRMLEDLCHIPVAGVIPYMDIDIEDEDSLSSRLDQTDNPGIIDIAVIRFPRISNFTDFNVFSCIQGVSLRYVSRREQLGSPDLVILPGTKSTIEDLLWLRQNGLEGEVLKLAEREVPVFGICGGYQMMGKELIDKLGVEQAAGHEQVAGMGLLPMNTSFEPEKTRTCVSGAFGELSGIFQELSGVETEGYEIHMGQMERAERQTGDSLCLPLTFMMEVQNDSKKVKTDGLCRDHIYGTYVHGIFDKGQIAQTMVNCLLKKKGYEEQALTDFDYTAYKEKQYDLLADQLRSSLDMEQIYKILNVRPDSKRLNGTGQ